MDVCLCLCCCCLFVPDYHIGVYTHTHKHTSTLRCNTRDVVKRARCNTLRARRPRYANDVSPNAAQLNVCVCVRANRFLGAGRPTDRPAVRPCTARFIAQLVRRTAYGGRRRRWPECCHTRVRPRYRARARGMFKCVRSPCIDISLRGERTATSAAVAADGARAPGPPHPAARGSRSAPPSGDFCGCCCCCSRQ